MRLQAFAAMEVTDQQVPPEPRWPAFVGFAAIAVLSLAHPPALSAGPRWLVLGATGVLLVPAAIAHRTGRHSLTRALTTTANAFVMLTMIWSLALLIGALPEHKIRPATLLRSAAALWVTNVLVFALWYWRLDAGGPHARERRARHSDGAFLFPQMMMRDSAAAEWQADWSPHFVDYLFLAFTTSTALSPADVQPLSRWAKLMMIAQASISLVIIALLAARGVNIL
jgi:hypothetical protein